MVLGTGNGHGQVQQESFEQGRQGAARAKARQAQERPLREESEKPQAGDCNRALTGTARGSEGAAEAIILPQVEVFAQEIEKVKRKDNVVLTCEGEAAVGEDATTDAELAERELTRAGLRCTVVRVETESGCVRRLDAPPGAASLEANRAISRALAGGRRVVVNDLRTRRANSDFVTSRLPSLVLPPGALARDATRTFSELP